MGFEHATLDIARRELVALYARHSPKKLDDPDFVDSLLRKWEGQHELLLRTVRNKYGQTVSAAVSVPSSPGRGAIWTALRSCIGRCIWTTLRSCIIGVWTTLRSRQLRQPEGSFKDELGPPTFTVEPPGLMFRGAPPHPRTHTCGQTLPSLSSPPRATHTRTHRFGAMATAQLCWCCCGGTVNLNTQAVDTLYVTNPHDRDVCFNLKCTAPRRYCARPNAARIPPQQTVKVKVSTQAMDRYPAEENCKDRFLVQMAWLPDKDMGA